jgi:hypothetical protein
VIADHKDHDLPRSPAHHHPQPVFPGAFAHKRPDLIEFQTVIGSCGLERSPQRWQRQEFFLIQAARVFRETPNTRLIPRILGRS